MAETKTKIRPTPSDYPEPSGSYGKMPTVVFRDYGNSIRTWQVHGERIADERCSGFEGQVEALGVTYLIGRYLGEGNISYIHDSYGTLLHSWGKIASVSSDNNNLILKASKAASKAVPEPAEELDDATA